MDSELKSNRAGVAVPVSVGERVTIADSATEYIVVSVDHRTGKLELLRLNPGRIESELWRNVVRKSPASRDVIAEEN